MCEHEHVQISRAVHQNLQARLHQTAAPLHHEVAQFQQHLRCCGLPVKLDGRYHQFGSSCGFTVCDGSVLDWSCCFRLCVRDHPICCHDQGAGNSRCQVVLFPCSSIFHRNDHI